MKYYDSLLGKQRKFVSGYEFVNGQTHLIRGDSRVSKITVPVVSRETREERVVELADCCQAVHGYPEMDPKEAEYLMKTLSDFVHRVSSQPPVIFSDLNAKIAGQISGKEEAVKNRILERLGVNLTITTNGLMFVAINTLNLATDGSTLRAFVTNIPFFYGLAASSFDLSLLRDLKKHAIYLKHQTKIEIVQARDMRIIFGIHPEVLAKINEYNAQFKDTEYHEEHCYMIDINVVSALPLSAVIQFAKNAEALYDKVKDNPTLTEQKTRKQKR